MQIGQSHLQETLSGLGWIISSLKLGQALFGMNYYYSLRPELDTLRAEKGYFRVRSGPFLSELSIFQAQSVILNLTWALLIRTFLTQALPKIGSEPNPLSFQFLAGV